MARWPQAANCKRAVMLACGALLLPAGAAAAAETSSYASPVAPVLLTLMVLLVAAKLGGDLFERLDQPAVLGELLCGVLLGNLNLFGYDGFLYLRHDEALELFAELGVILLLFEIGLESSVREMFATGLSSFLVAVLGVIVPMLLGAGTSIWFYPHAGASTHLFIGATLCATSVGISARVLQDLGRMRTREARIVLGAAVIDDILGLVILATLTGMTAAAGGDTPAASATMVLGVMLKAIAFLGGALGLGYFGSPLLLGIAGRFRVRGMLLTTALLLCFLLSYLAGWVGLAPIVGAFAAGLIIEERHSAVFAERGEPPLHALVNPLVTFLAPLFFVRMGLLVDLRTLADVTVLAFALTLTAAAIVGKQVCGFGVLEHGLNRLSVGLAMIPRGEVGLIFANIGAVMVIGGRPAIGPDGVSAVVIMVMVTTFMTPPLLRWAVGRRGERRE